MTTRLATSVLKTNPGTIGSALRARCTSVHVLTRQAPSASRQWPARQGGVALVVALLLLVVITLVGLAGVRGTILQQKMASNLFDRQVAFQSAEAALRVAAAQIPNNIARNCQLASVVCMTNPFEDNSLPDSKIVLVSTGDYTASTVSNSQPQYVIENMGTWANPDMNTGYGQSANSKNYGGSAGGSPTAIYYRITARSGDPATVGARAVVTLQAMIKQG